MTFLLLNVILCSAVLIAVVAPLVRAIRAGQRDQPVVTARPRLARRPAAYASARSQASHSKPVILAR